MYILTIFLVFISVQSVFSKYYTRIGQHCPVEGVPGTCKVFYNCQYAINMVVELKQHPTMCYFDEQLNVPITCCPTNETSIVSGPKIMARLFKPSRLRKTEDMTCMYGDQEPFLCCKNRQKTHVESEPEGCPKLPKPELDTSVHTVHPAWEKCVSYQQYFNVCVATDESNKHFIRNDTGISLDKKEVMRILGGTTADIMEFPHMAAIGVRESGDIDIRWIGGGSLISDRFVLTAAHVALSKAGLARYALLGVVNKLHIRDGLLCNIIKRYAHPFYDKKGNIKGHDIALLELFDRVQFNQFIRPACLPVPGRKIEKTYTVAGWGETENSNNSPLLLYVSVQNEPKRCKDVYKGDFKSDIMMCMHGLHMESADSCKGDSGGPLMAKFTNLNRSYSVEGIVSFGVGCGNGAGVYTKVSEYMDYIMKIVWKKEWSIYNKKLNS